MRRTPVGSAMLLSALLAAGPGHASAPEQRIGVRVGEHPTHGRIVFDGPGGAPPAYQLVQEQGRLRIRFADPSRVDLGAARRPPRNVAGLAATEGGVEVTLRSPDVRVRHYVLGTRVVVDLLDPSLGPPGEPPDRPGTARRAGPSGTQAVPGPPAPAALVTPAVAPMPPARARTEPDDSAAQAGREATQAPAEVRPASDMPQARSSAVDMVRPARGPAPADPPPRREPGQPAGPVPPPVTASTGAAQPAPSPTVPAMAQGAAAPRDASAPAPTLLPPDALPVRLVFGPPGQPRAVLLPFAEDVGLAILRRGESLMVVLDSPQPLNLAALRGDPVFGAMEARTLPGGSLLVLRLAEPAGLVARRRDGAWALTATTMAAGMPTTPPALEVLRDAPGPRLLLRAADPGRIVGVTDPETGLPLLVGTLRRPGTAQPQLRRLPEVDLLPTLNGLAALARSDRVSVRGTAEGFVIGAAGGGALALDPAIAAPQATQVMTRLFDLPALPVPLLAERLRSEHAAVRAAAPLERAGLRRAAAETLLALGLPQEAQGMLALALAEDPAAAQDPVLGALSGAAALLAGRPAEAEGLARTDLPDRDETILWRALLATARGQGRAAAPSLAATLPLVLAYPAGLQARLLGPVAEALAEAGDAASLARLLERAGDRPELGFARAALAEAEGRAEAALAGYDAVAQGRDRAARARALRRAVELRLAAGTLTPAEAAQALDAALFAWRGDGQEVATRLRIARLRTEAGEPRAALEMLRETEQLFPEQAEAIREGIQSAFLAALEREPPLGAVALHDAHPDLLPADGRGDAALLLLADRLAALDLTERAATLLRGAAARAAAGSARRAELGLRLARLQIERGNLPSAQEALASTNADALPADLARDRAILAARLDARRGEVPGAIAALQALGPDGAEALAEILADAQDFAGAARAQATHLAATLPPAPAPLDEAQARAVLRQAALLGLANDSAGLAALAAAEGARLAGTPFADSFAALTADPLRGLADLPRLQRELRLFRALPGALPGRREPLRAASLVTR